MLGRLNEITAAGVYNGILDLIEDFPNPALPSQSPKMSRCREALQSRLQRPARGDSLFTAFSG